jgi:2-dehydro-3-deoxygluconokinase
MTPRHVLAVGEAMGCVTPVIAGTIAHSRELRMGIGGAESNVAIGLTRLGIPAVWASRLGDDSVGDLIRRELRAEGVGLAVIDDSTATTGLMLKERLNTGHARVSYYRRGSAASRLAPGDIPDALLDEARLVHISGVTLALSESTRATVHDVIARATRRGIPVSFDLNHRSLLWDDDLARSAYRSILSRCDVLFASEAEAELLVGPGAPEDAARRIAALGPRTVAIKYGAAGAFGLHGEETHWQDAIPVDVVDTVGAGDAFAAGFLAATLDGASLAERLLLGAAAGALACTSVGDWEGAPTRADIDRLLGYVGDVR